MKYAIEINNNEVIETLVVNGKEYKKKWRMMTNDKRRSNKSSYIAFRSAEKIW
jgi:hypothetical protein